MVSNGSVAIQTVGLNCLAQSVPKVCCVSLYVPVFGNTSVFKSSDNVPNLGDKKTAFKIIRTNTLTMTNNTSQIRIFIVGWPKL